jgi:hypothetical protein
MKTLTDHDIAIRFFTSIGYMEGDEIYPMQYRLDNEEDGTTAIITATMKLWYAPDGHLIQADHDFKSLKPFAFNP